MRRKAQSRPIANPPIMVMPLGLSGDGTTGIDGRVEVAVAERVSVGVAVAVPPIGSRVLVVDALFTGDGVIVGGVAVPSPGWAVKDAIVAVGVMVCVGVVVSDGEFVGVEVPPIGSAVKVAAAPVGLGVIDAVRVGVAIGVSVGVFVEVAVCVGVSVGVVVGVLVGSSRQAVKLSLELNDPVKLLPPPPLPPGIKLCF